MAIPPYGQSLEKLEKAINSLAERQIRSSMVSVLENVKDIVQPQCQQDCKFQQDDFCDNGYLYFRPAIFVIFHADWKQAMVFRFKRTNSTITIKWESSVHFSSVVVYPVIFYYSGHLTNQSVKQSCYHARNVNRCTQL